MIDIEDQNVSILAHSSISITLHGLKESRQIEVNIWPEATERKLKNIKEVGYFSGVS